MVGRSVRGDEWIQLRGDPSGEGTRHTHTGQTQPILSTQRLRLFATSKQAAHDTYTKLELACCLTWDLPIIELAYYAVGSKNRALFTLTIRPNEQKLDLNSPE